MLVEPMSEDTSVASLVEEIVALADVLLGARLRKATPQGKVIKWFTGQR
jgi:hypothetical protein